MCSRGGPVHAFKGQAQGRVERCPEDGGRRSQMCYSGKYSGDYCPVRPSLNILFPTILMKSACTMQYYESAEDDEKPAPRSIGGYLTDFATLYPQDS
jgi:hypothetical protein